jgi:hypothetical protein
VEGKGNMNAPAYASLGSYSLVAHATPGGVLALHKLELFGNINGDKHELNWIIEATESVIQQTLEISSDGRNFQPLTQSPNDERSYSYRPYNISSAKYRLNVVFGDGHQYYSNIVTISQKGPRPKLTGTLIGSNSLVVSSPGNYDYMIMDANSRLLNKGKLTTGVNNINTSTTAGGMYLIRFWNNEQQWTDKFIRQ